MRRCFSAGGRDGGRGTRFRLQAGQRDNKRPLPGILTRDTFTDAEVMDMLEANKDWVFVAPGITWLIATLYEAEAFGFPQEAAEAVGYKKELDMAVKGLQEMHRRGIRVLPGGDYGFAWTPHGTYARDLQHFVERLGFTPMEAILSAPALGGEIMLRPDELGKVQPGYLADLLLVDGDPLADITVLQDHSKLNYIMKDGRFHKEHAEDDHTPPAPHAADLVHDTAERVVERRP